MYRHRRLLAAQEAAASASASITPPQVKRVATQSDYGRALSPAARRAAQLAHQREYDAASGVTSTVSPAAVAAAHVDPIAAAPLISAELARILEHAEDAAVDAGLPVDAIDGVLSAIITASTVRPGVNIARTGYDGDDRHALWAAATTGAAAHVTACGYDCNVVFGSAGIGAVAYGEAFVYLKKLGLASRIVNWAGSGTGSIVAALLACGMEPERISRLSLVQSYAKVVRKEGVIRKRAYGALRGKRLIAWLRTLIEDACGDPYVTLGQLHERNGGRLVLTVTDLTTTRPVYLDYRIAPDLQLALALRMSAGAPQLFAPYAYNGGLYCDGSLLDPLPMRAFHCDVSGSANPRTIGVIATCSGVSACGRKPTSRIGKICALLDCAISRAQSGAMDAGDYANTIVVDCGDMSVADFGINVDQLHHLHELARMAVVRHYAATSAQPHAGYYVALSTGYMPGDEPAIQRNFVVKTVKRVQTVANTVASTVPATLPLPPELKLPSDAAETPRMRISAADLAIAAAVIHDGGDGDELTDDSAHAGDATTRKKRKNKNKSKKSRK